MTIPIRQQIDDGTAGGADMALTLSSAQVGDTVVVLHADDFHTLAGLSSPTGTAVSSWTEIRPGGNSLVDGGTDDSHCKGWTGTVTTGGGTVLEGTANTDHERYLGAWALVGAVDFDTALATQVDTTSTSHVAPSVTPTSGKTDDLLICLFGTGPFDSAVNYTMPGSMTARTERDCGTFCTFRGADEQLASDAATGTRTATASAAFQWFAVSVLMKSTGGAPEQVLRPIQVLVV